MNLRRFIIPCFVLMALVPLLPAQEKPAPESIDAAAWITHVEGRVFFQNFEKAEVDKAVNPGDEIITQKGRIEVELGEGNWIRLDQHTRVVFSDIQKDSTTLSLWEGSVYLHLKNQTVKIRSPKGERLIQDKGLVRIDIDQNDTKIVNSPKAVDDFDGWNRIREEELASSMSETGRYDSPRFYGGGFSPFWPGSCLDIYGWFYPYWSFGRPYMWPYYAWPSWYFGWNPFWYGDFWYAGYGGYFGGFYARGYGRGGHRFDGGIRRGGFRGSPRASGIYPSRIAARAIRSSSNPSGSRTAYGTARSGSSRSIAPRSSNGSGSGARSSSGSSGSRSGGASRSGGSSRGGGGGHRR